MTVLTEDVTAVLDNYADAIEGGNSYRGSGTEYKGVPGVESAAAVISDVGTITVDGSSDTDTVGWTSATNFESGRLVRSYGPPLFALCGSATNEDNEGAARKITSWGSASFDVSPAFPAAVSAADTFTLREGFKRAPDKWDLEADDVGTPGEFDRFFQISSLPGSRMGWYGNNLQHYQTEMELRLRILKRNRGRRAIDSALRNLLLLRTILTRSEHRGSFVQVLRAEETEPEIQSEDATKVVVLDKYQLQYRINAEFS